MLLFCCCIKRCYCKTFMPIGASMIYSFLFCFLFLHTKTNTRRSYLSMDYPLDKKEEKIKFFPCTQVCVSVFFFNLFIYPLQSCKKKSCIQLTSQPLLTFKYNYHCIVRWKSNHKVIFMISFASTGCIRSDCHVFERLYTFTYFIEFGL